MGRTALFSFLLNLLPARAAFGHLQDQHIDRTTAAVPTARRFSTGASPELSPNAGRFRKGEPLRARTPRGE